MDLAASIQAVTDEVVLRLTRSHRRETGARNLCLAGGVALNCVANGKIVRDGKFDRDLDAAGGGRRRRRARRRTRGYHLYLNQPRLPHNTLDAMQGAYLGPRFHANRYRAAACRVRRGVRRDGRRRADRRDASMR